ncbi:MAG: hypothetical protein WBC70_00525 [Candidatus Aminicenantales bacterium]
MKSKSIFRFGIPLLITAFLVIGPRPAFAQEAKAFIGDWKGAVSVPEADIDIVCHFQLDADGNLTGTIDSPTQGAFGLKLASITVEGKKISFGVDDPNVPGDPKLEGTLDETGTKISGVFSQGGSEGTFELTKQ